VLAICLINLVSVIVMCGFSECHTFGYVLLKQASLPRRAFADPLAAFAGYYYIAVMTRSARRLKGAPGPSGLAEEAAPFVYDDIVRGIPAKRVQALIDRGVLGEKAVYRVIPERTFKRRLANREALKVSEGDAIARLVRVTEEANRIFGDAEFSRKWLNLPNPVLKGQVPIELAETDAGAREVEGALLSFAYGDYH
jgi:putative toxin-antitoxin system antitoxin component (TIGR02293 family)